MKKKLLIQRCKWSKKHNNKEHYISIRKRMETRNEEKKRIKWLISHNRATSL